MAGFSKAQYEAEAQKLLKALSDRNQAYSSLQADFRTVLAQREQNSKELYEAKREVEALKHEVEYQQRQVKRAQEETQDVRANMGGMLNLAATVARAAAGR